MKRNKKSWCFFVVLGIISLTLAESFAEESSQPTASTANNDTPAKDSTQKKKSTKSKGRVPREKEAEGTQAPNRFDTDIIIKSKHELNGQSLEVDTD